MYNIMETLARSAFCIPPDRQFRPVTFYFVLTFHVLGVAGFVRLFQYSWVTWLEVYALWQLSGLGITAGSHRLWAHRSYKAKLPLRIFLVLLNSFAHEGSILWSPRPTLAARHDSDGGQNHRARSTHSHRQDSHRPTQTGGHSYTAASLFAIGAEPVGKANGKCRPPRVDS